MVATATLFLAMMIPLVWSPGPNNVMCATVGAKQGTKGSVPFILGLNIPIFIYALLTGFGLTAILSNIPQLASALTILGALYVTYLGVKLITATSGGSVEEIQYGFRSGFIVSSLNFKVVTVLIVMYSQFVSDRLYFSIVLALSFVLVCIVGHFLWNTIGRISSRLLKSDKFLKMQNFVYGAMLVGVGVWMFVPALNSVIY
ncbi:LysE family translocator [Aidingimonas halophila]|uniref:Threonine/homoserine/homoserine lactone efflux protein n=1 Tax=Aidingimonas halophila TaxID=574349 RepID=A0A1H3A482_9GAMM|nr:LysE family translocator [Aidingimonas halophila]GHC21478.1 amino acid transporter LysE [Aidingimonas halophila]SDX24024.1 Threonine/homoserine/homoserine lactone efflux protein [Aidingimonas halophila]